MKAPRLVIQLHIVNGGACASCRKEIRAEPIADAVDARDVGPALIIIKLYHPSCAPS